MVEPYHMTLKIILLGDYSVDKGALLRTLSTMPKQPEVTCVGSCVGMVEMMFVRGEKRVRVKINDTVGQERYRSITSSYYRGAHGCVLLFDVTQRSTFDALYEWYRELFNNSMSDDLVVTLAGCNCHVTGSERQVARRTAQEFAEYLGVTYEEVTVRNKSTFVQTIEGLVDRIIYTASRSTVLSHSIKPLDQKMQERWQQEQMERTKCAC